MHGTRNLKSTYTEKYPKHKKYRQINIVLDTLEHYCCGQGPKTKLHGAETDGSSVGVGTANYWGLILKFSK